ncbi:hypothetical protein MKX01_035015 [Papaver californicum]|nr:hypothetical protein MKX01_035015 [Papaver californicum]
MSFGMKAAEELGIPGVQFWTASACGFMACLHLGELIKRGLVPFKDADYITNGCLDMVIDWEWEISDSKIYQDSLERLTQMI